MDEILFYALNEEFSGDGIGEMMVLITSPETWWAPLILLSVSLLIIDWRKGLTAILVALAAVGFGDWFAHNILKTYFGVIRPCNALEGVHLLVGCTQSFSFPSNHAVNSLAVAGAIGFWFPLYLAMLVPIGLLVCLSRIAVGVHYPSDVIVGAILGFCIGYGFSYITKRWILKQGDDVVDAK